MTFAKVQELKGTGISIAHDLTPDDRIARKILYKHLITAREQDSNAKIKDDKVLVDGNLLSIENYLRWRSRLMLKTQTPTTLVIKNSIKTQLKPTTQSSRKKKTSKDPVGP